MANKDSTESEVISSESSSKNNNDSTQLQTSTALLLVFLIFCISLSSILFTYYSFPKLESYEINDVKFPTNLQDAKKLGLILSRYTDRYYLQVLIGISITYLFLQTFAIPGSIFLSIISGYLFPFHIALFLICFCSSTGASFCYLLSFLVGRRLVYTYIPEKAESWCKQIETQRDNLLSYIIFLRITPLLPNWFINIVSPLLDVPLSIFWIGTFIGVAPPSFIAIQAGTTLQKLTSTTDTLTLESVGLLILFAVLSILPVLYKYRYKCKFE